MAILRKISDCVLSGGSQHVTAYVVISVKGKEWSPPPLSDSEVVLKAGMKFLPFFMTDIEQIVFLGKTNGCLALGALTSTDSYASARIEKVEFSNEGNLIVTTQNAVFIAFVEPMQPPSWWQKFLRRLR